MSLILEKEIDGLKHNILLLGGMVEEQVHLAVKSIVNHDQNMADAVIAKDEAIDKAEVEMEENCLKLLALHQPVAIDLRFIIAVLKINSELERIADLAVNICERTKLLQTQSNIEDMINFPKMAERVEFMLKTCLDSLVNLDEKMAVNVCEIDKEVDALNQQVFEIVQEKMTEPSENIADWLHLLNVSHQLERIGDLSTNIAEDILYMIEGRIVRHQIDDVFGN